MAHVRAFGALTAEQCEVGLLIFPELPSSMRAGLEGARAFEQLCAALRERMQRESPDGPPFYCVAFHPELNIDLKDENRAVRFIRRSPDPTIQLVRVSVLTEARGAQGDTLYVDASKLSHEELMRFERPLTISEKIAKANFETLQREGPERLRELLAGMARR